MSRRQTDAAMGALTFSTEPRALEPRFSANTLFSDEESPRQSESEGELSDDDDWIFDRDAVHDIEEGSAPIDEEEDEVATEKSRGLTVAFKVGRIDLPF